MAASSSGLEVSPNGAARLLHAPSAYMCRPESRGYLFLTYAQVEQSVREMGE